MKPLSELMAPDWAEALEPVAPKIEAMFEFLDAEDSYLPARENILRAFAESMTKVKVLIVGQDPYPTPRHPVGLSFSVAPDISPLPKSLVNIFTVLKSEGFEASTSGDLSPWAKQGVLLLNRVLTVRPGEPNSHRNKGWEPITEQAIRSLVARDKPLVAILWGKEAQALKPLLGNIPAIESPHPSPLSAWRGFLTSKPFRGANAELAAQGAEPVHWSLTPIG